MKCKAFFRKMRRDGLTAGAMIIDGKKYNYIPPARKRRVPKTILIIFIIALSAAALYFIYTQQKGAAASNPPSAGPASIPDADNGRVLELILDGENTQELQSYLQKVKYRDAGDEFGWTALHWAVLMKNSRAAYLLIQHGADPNARSTRDWYIFAAGSTPRDIARSLNFYL